MTAFGLGIDAGGTYTDTAIVDLGTGKVVSGNKALTTRDDLSLGIRRSLEGLDRDALGKVSLASLSSTLATNSVVEGKGCRVGLLCIGKSYRLESGADAYAEVDGRFSMSGIEEIPLDTDSVRQSLEGMKGRIDALAISGYVSVRNPAHEDMAAGIASEVLGLPVVRGHELTSKLGFDERTSTAVMNARLIPAVSELIGSVRMVLKNIGVSCPLMVVKGDGALMKDSTALERPVETILSGPASSMVGARCLAGLDDAVVIDIGGTTSDIGILRNGRPKVEPEGARLGGYRTRVTAADIAAFGIGGDSRIVVNGSEMILSPVRVIPICVASTMFPSVRETILGLKDAPCCSVPERCPVEEIVQDTEFVVATEKRTYRDLAEEDRLLLDMLSSGPCRLIDAAMKLDVPVHAFSVAELEERGEIMRIGVTPTDLLHACGDCSIYDGEASSVAVGHLAGRCGMSEEGFIAMARDRVIRKIAACTMERILLDESNDDVLDQSRRFLIDSCISTEHRAYSTSFSLEMPIIGIGAPAAAWLPAVADILHTESVIPKNHEIGNAVGAITGSVSETAEILVRARTDDPLHIGEYYVIAPGSVTRFASAEEAIDHAEKEAVRIVSERAAINGCSTPVIETGIDEDRTGTSPGCDMLFRAVITARAVGKPDLSG